MVVIFVFVVVVIVVIAIVEIVVMVVIGCYRGHRCRQYRLISHKGISKVMKTNGLDLSPNAIRQGC